MLYQIPIVSADEDPALYGQPAQVPDKRKPCGVTWEASPAPIFDPLPMAAVAPAARSRGEVQHG
jgi:hypothetical protein